MPNLRCTGLVPLTLAGALLAGCASAPKVAAPAAPPVAPADPAIWKQIANPHILPRVLLTNGKPQSVDLYATVATGVTRVRSARVEGTDAVRATALDGTMLELLPTREADSQGVVIATVEDPAGGTHEVAFVVATEFRPTRKFTFRAPEGTTARSVSVAGSFNGWNASAMPLKDEDGDGLWEADVPLDPGKWSYKFVVDGNWITDPANPNYVEDGGNRNSLVEVTGRAADAPAPLNIALVPANMAGTGAQGGLSVKLAAGELLDPASCRVMVDNRLLGREEFSVDAQRGLIRLNVDAARWDSEQFVTAVVKSTSGASGFVQLPFDFTASPRSPRDETIYYVVLDRFANGDPGNDDPVDDPDVHPLNNYMGGDIEGVLQYMRDGYFDRLGVTTLWISPPYKQPDIAYQDSKPPHRKLTGYHGYWPVDMRAVDPRWGSIEELATLTHEAHKHGIAVIIDFVSNHLHESNPLVAEHPDWFNELKLPDGSVNIRQYDAHPFTTWFDEFLPDIAYDKTPAANQYMIDTAVWLLDHTDADGFRHDAVKHVPNVFWEGVTKALNERVAGPRHKRLYQVGETVSSRATIDTFIGPRLLDGQFDFPLFWTIEDTFGWERKNLVDAAGSLQDSVDQYPVDAIMSPFLGNHDVPRFMGKAEGDNKPGSKAEAEENSFTNPAHVDDVMSYRKLELAFAFLMTIPGTPMVYYGDELGMTGSGRPDARRMFIPPTEWNGDQQATYDVVQALFHARKESVALRRGVYQLLSATPESLVYARVAPEEVVLVAIQRKNAVGSAETIALPSAWGTPSGLEFLAGTADSTGDLSLDGSNLSLAPRGYSAGVWRLKL